MNIQISSVGCYKADKYGIKETQESKKLSLEHNAAVKLYYTAAKRNVISLATLSTYDCLEKSTTQVEEIDSLIHVSNVPDYIWGDVTRIQREIGASNSTTYQLKNTNGTEVLMAFVHAATYIESGIYRNVMYSFVANNALPICTNGSKIGDVATAVLLTATNNTSTECYSRKDTQYWVDILRQLSCPKERSLNLAIKKYAPGVVVKHLKTLGPSLSALHWYLTENACEHSVTEWREALELIREMQTSTVI